MVLLSKNKTGCVYLSGHDAVKINLATKLVLLYLPGKSK